MKKYTSFSDVFQSETCPGDLPRKTESHEVNLLTPFAITQNCSR